jgi:hypothetical protein
MSAAEAARLNEAATPSIRRRLIVFIDRTPVDARLKAQSRPKDLGLTGDYQDGM